MVVLMPLAGRGAQVIDPRWNTFHRPTATATMDAECIITRPSGTGTTDADGTYTPSPGTPIYTGVCRVVTMIRTDAVQISGEAQETHRRLQVGIRYDAPEIRPGDLVDITMTADPQLLGRKLRVLEVAFGSEQWQRNLICDEREA